jgi:putative Mn2+ efflux pump MntP
MKIAAVLAAAQTLLLAAGWLLGAPVNAYMMAFGHRIAFALLAFTGGKMIMESFGKTTPRVTTLQHLRTLLAVALATSIDAMAAGASLAFVRLPLSGLLTESALVFFTTAAVALAGMLGGNRLSRHLGARAELLGGIILLAIGIKIVLMH